MRTDLSVQAWKHRNKISNFLNGERHYRVEGHIAFEFVSHDREPDLHPLREAILEVDREFPWCDDVYPGVKFKSIHFLNAGSITRNNRTCIEYTAWFHIFPYQGNVRKGQVYAYEKYLAKIAEELSKRELPNVKSVRSGITMTAVTSFECGSEK